MHPPPVPAVGRPLTLGPVRLRNRFVAAPMERNYCEPDGTATGRYAAYLGRRAHGGAALVFAEAAYVRADGKGRHRQLGVAADAHVAGLAQLAGAVHAGGALFGVELNHGGRTAQSAVSGLQPVAPSPVPCLPAGGELPRQLATGEVYELVEAYAEGARRCRDAGVDVIMIHGAHGYLVHQFLSPAFNLRTDEFADPLRFLGLVVEAVRSRAGGEVAVGLRLSAHEGFEGGLTAEDTFGLISRARLELLDFLDVSAGSYEAGQWIIQPAEWERGLLAPYARRYRALGLPVGVAGRISTLERAEEIVAGGSADFVSLARALHAEPDFPRLALAGRSYRPCIGCNLCIDRLGSGEAIPCAVNAGAGREYLSLEGMPARSVDAPARLVAAPPRLVAAPARRGTVLVVGAGPAGLEAARLLAVQGQRVELLEREQHVGGRLALAGRLRTYPEHDRLLRWCADEVERLGVRVRTGVTATEEELARYEADAIVLATGGTARLPDVPGIRLPHVLDVRDWLARSLDVPRTCVVWGADREGVAVSDHLATGGAEVLIVGEQPSLAPEVGRRAKILMVPRLTGNPKVRVMLESTVAAIEPGRVLVRSGAEAAWVPAPGPLLVSQGIVPRTGLLAACQARGPALGVHVIGDAAGGGSLHRCFLEAAEVAGVIGAGHVQDW
ncbi:oxidoreductase [Nonomuraea gerenzanensis]|uniref:Probable flavin oxidoreductase n=1 Tax=Nonomuraea gerenzanensis TaxID=93944 RepID=A0A1M4EGE3_9ACTN|nr:FAD-dependent oxidoreductase [Nonomuraea gerenzanensis]UBU09419.1 FAD-dependent oxidoreductase [Nonomuraea gerenzanensis]SBO97834.1 probable flavin oxidoreductase [Nonomuraea gerenzanensis]